MRHGLPLVTSLFALVLLGSGSRRRALLRQKLRTPCTRTRGSWSTSSRTGPARRPVRRPATGCVRDGSPPRSSAPSRASARRFGAEWSRRTERGFRLIAVGEASGVRTEICIDPKAPAAVKARFERAWWQPRADGGAPPFVEVLSGNERTKTDICNRREERSSLSLSLLAFGTGRGRLRESACVRQQAAVAA